MLISTILRSSQCQNTCKSSDYCYPTSLKVPYQNQMKVFIMLYNFKFYWHYFILYSSQLSEIVLLFHTKDNEIERQDDHIKFIANKW